MRKRFFFILLLLIVCSVSAQTLRGGGEANPELLTNQESLQAWQDMRFGMFIHWGPVALRGTEIGWSRGKEVKTEEYDKLYQEFNPVLFDADEWVQVAKNAGMKYIILVTKHHDGFSLWDSDYTDYDIMASPFKRDIVREISDACKRHDILFGTYYSVLDWYHPDYAIKSSINRKYIWREKYDMSGYIDFMKGQLKELVNEYGTRILWFDGEWEEPWTHEMGLDLYSWARKLDDTLLINNRVDKDRKDMDNPNKAPIFAGDFATPEQRIGAFNTKTPWETCMTICQQWAWKPNDRLKSYKECLHTLLRTVGGDGNLLLNLSPMADGRLEQRQVAVLNKLGAWLNIYGETVYGTRGGPVPPQPWGVTTNKGDYVYAFVFEQNGGAILLPHVRVKSAALFKSGNKVKYENTGMGVVLDVPKAENEIVSVIKLEFK